MPVHSRNELVIRGARQHNLKDVTISLPRERLVVITGVSGSGKSSLAFDTIYAEGQRRYVESLSVYARQFLGQMDKPDVDAVEGLSPAIAIDQKGGASNPRSTVGTATEIYDHLRLLYARVGHPHCPSCGREVVRQTVGQIVDAILTLPDGSRVMVAAPLIRDRAGDPRQVLDEVRRAGFARIRVDGQVRDLGDDLALDPDVKHTIEVVVDRLVVHPAPVARPGDLLAGAEPHPDATRLADSVETALKLSSGIVIAAVVGGADQVYSQSYACPFCGLPLGELEPRSFSFNSPRGACPTCDGLGSLAELDPDLVVPNRELSLAEGAIVPWEGLVAADPQSGSLLDAAIRSRRVPTDRPWGELTEEQRGYLLRGDGKPLRARQMDRFGHFEETEVVFDGVLGILERRRKTARSDRQKWEIEAYVSPRPCPACRGARLRQESLLVTFGGLSIVDVTAKPLGSALRWCEEVTETLTGREQAIARPILREIAARLRFLVDVGLDYLSLDRPSSTLSGGEAQRIRLGTQIGSALSGVLYVLDEPSIGLHQRDNRRLIDTLVGLRDLGNTVLVVEHDEETIRAADYVVDVGPGAGEHGGQIVAAGSLAEVLESPDSLTAKYLRGERRIRIPPERRTGSGHWLEVRGARANNLRNLDVRFPLGTLIAVTGVSGSGKSTLVTDILYRKAAQVLARAPERPAEHDAVFGLDQIDKVIAVDQSPIGRTPRSNPATYVGAYGVIRELFASVPEARARGYQPGRFSFNVKGGRCEACQGEGTVRIEMEFLSDVYVPCEVCHGRRFSREALEIHFKGLSIADVLDLTVAEALRLFDAIPGLRQRLQVLDDVGLGYLRLGQPATTLSGGEAQRVKLAAEFARRATGRTLYVLDEPTTGLHFADVDRLLHVLHRLVDAGNTVVVIEHNLDVVKNADWVIDLGPEGGDEGGRIVAAGTPEQIAECAASHTGRYLISALEVARRAG